MIIRHSVFAAVTLFLSALIASPKAPAQEKKISRKKVPAAVLSAFAKSYPQAKIKGTSTETEKGNTYYEIESLDGKQARDVLYLADGTASEVEEVVSPGALPDPVKSAVAGEFAKAKIVKAEMVTKGSEVSYEIRVTSGSKRGSIVVSPTGTMLEKSPLKEKKVGNGKEENGEEDD